MSHSWKNVLIKPDCKIRDALGIINSEALRVAIVVDEDDGLLGIVTDGDIRRGLLKGFSLDINITQIMNVDPIVASSNQSKTELINIMESRDILCVPIVNGMRIVGLQTLHDALHQDKLENPVFIMAGGFGARLKPLTDNCPKPMLKIGGVPMLEILIRRFIKLGFVNFYISTHYMSEQIINHFNDGSSLGVSITYVHEESPLGTGGALGLLPEDLPENLPLIMMNGDVLTTVDFHRLLDFHINNDAVATMCVRDYDYQIPYGVINGEGHKITSMVEKPIQRFFINAGIYIVSPNVIKSVPKNFSIDMPTLLESHMLETEKVLMFPIHEYWLDIGRMDDFNRAQVDIHSLGLNA